MNVIWYKVWHDIWHNKSRSLLVILSITAGIFSIGAIFGIVEQLQNGMDEAHQAVNPSHINIFLTNPIDRLTAEDLATIPGVAGVEPINRINVRYKTRTDTDWREGTLTMRGDYQDQVYDLVTLKEGIWPNGYAIGLERLTGQHFGIVMGDEVVFELEGVDRPFTVNSLIRHPFVEPPLFGGEAHFFTDEVGLAKFGIPAGYFASLLITVEPYSQELAEETAGEIRKRLGDQGHGVAVTIYQEPERHWGHDFVDGIMVVLRVMAVVSLFLSVVLVTNTFTAVITQQTDQIGVIKAIGGAKQVIVKIYLSGVLFYSFLALLLALPLGALTAFAGSRWFLNLFNIDLEALRFSPAAVMWQAVSALAVPILAALWPVMRGANISVRAAIASYGLGGDFGSSRFDKMLEHWSGRYLSSLYATSVGNMFRRKGRLVLTQLVLTAAGVMFLIVMTLITSTNFTLDNEMARRGYDVRIGFWNPQRTEQVLAAANGLPEVTGAEVWYSRNATILRAGEQLQDAAGLGAQLTGLPPETMMQRPLITQGRWLQAGDDRVIVISQDFAEENDVAPEDTLRLDLGILGEASWQVLGTYKTVSGADFATETIYAPLDAVVDVTKQAYRGNLLYLATADDSLAGVKSVARQLKDIYEAQNMGVNLYTTAVKLQERADIETQFGSVVSMLLGLAMLVATVGGIGLMGALGIGVVERTREIGVLRAIGASSNTIMSLFVMEGVFQGLLSWLLAIPLAYFLSQPLAKTLGQTMMGIELDYAFSLAAVFIWLAAILVIAALASILPARAATRISVRQSLAYA